MRRCFRCDQDVGEKARFCSNCGLRLEERAAQGMTVPQLVDGLAEKYGSINAAARALSMPEGTLQALRQGRRQNPRLETLRIIARGYDKPLQEIVSWLEGDANSN